MSKLLIITGKEEEHKQKFMEWKKGFKTYINPENNKHPSFYPKLVQDIIKEVNDGTNIMVSTNSSEIVFEVCLLMQIHISKRCEKIKQQYNIINTISPNSVTLYDIYEVDGVIKPIKRLKDNEIYSEELNKTIDRQIEISQKIIWDD